MLDFYACLKQVDKNIKRCLRKSFHFFNSWMWPNLLIDDHHNSYIIILNKITLLGYMTKWSIQINLHWQIDLHLELKICNFVVYIKKLGIGFFFSFGQILYFFNMQVSSSYSIDQYSLILVRFPFNISYKDIMLHFNTKDILQHNIC